MDDTVVFEGLEVGDRVLFEGRKQPLTVLEDRGDAYLIEGPQGGEYVLHRDDDVLLLSKPGNRRYASRVEGLRTTGEWEQVGADQYRHTVTGAELELVESASGFLTIRAEGLEDDLDIPGYGFTDREHAEGALEDIIEDHPEGR